MKKLILGVFTFKFFKQFNTASPKKSIIETNNLNMHKENQETTRKIQKQFFSGVRSTADRRTNLPHGAM